MTRWLLLALALSGCDVLLELKHVDPVAIKVRGTFRYRTVVNTSMFQPMPVEVILAVEGNGLQAFLENGAEAPLEYREDGSFSFPVDYKGQPYRIRHTSGANSSEWQHTASEIAIGTLTAGRRDARPIVQTTVTLPNYTPVMPLQPAQISSTGVYTQTSTLMAAAIVSFDWRLVSPAPASIAGLLDATKHDRIYAYEHETTTVGNSPLYSRIRALSQTSISQALETTAMLPQLAPVAPNLNLCMHVTSTGTAARTRMMVTHPRMYTRELGNWLAYSAPAPDWVGLSGALYTAVCGFVGARDLDIKPVFPDPYLGTTLVAAASTSLEFLVQLPGTAVSRALSNGVRVYRAAERGSPAACTPAVTQLDATLGLPGAFALDDETLNFDNEEIALDLTRAPTLKWNVLAEGPIDYTNVLLHEVVAINNATEVVLRWSTSTVGTSAQIEPSILEVGHTYIFSVVPNLGRPFAADGDFMTIQLPLQGATIWTHTFIVRDPS